MKGLKKMYWELFVKRGLGRVHIREPHPDDVVGEKIFGAANFFGFIAIILGVLGAIFMTSSLFINATKTGEKILLFLFGIIVKMYGLIRIIYGIQYKNWREVVFFGFLIGWEVIGTFTD